jgi:hypothetical protein
MQHQMNGRESVFAMDKLDIATLARLSLAEKVVVQRAELRVSHKRPTNWLFNPFSRKFDIPDPDSYKIVEDDEVVHNQKTDVGIVQLHTQGYGLSGLLTNGFNWIALTNTAVTPAHGDTTLSGEITTNGLARAQGSVVLPTGTGTQTTVDKTFTATGTQSAQAAALFTAASVGVMNHELTFTQRNLLSGDTLETTYTITLS